jgi:hypothetical protein
MVSRSNKRHENNLAAIMTDAIASVGYSFDIKIFDHIRIRHF